MYLQMSLILRLPFCLCRCASAAAPSSEVQLSADLRAGFSYAASAPSAAQAWDLYSARCPPRLKAAMVAASWPDAMGRSFERTPKEMSTTTLRGPCANMCFGHF
jgi:hypothetical protein